METSLLHQGLLGGETQPKPKSERKPLFLSVLTLVVRAGTALAAVAGCTVQAGSSPWKAPCAAPSCRRCLRAGAAEKQKWKQQHTGVVLWFGGAVVKALMFLFTSSPVPACSFQAPLAAVALRLRRCLLGFTRFEWERGVPFWSWPLWQLCVRVQN